MKGTLFFRHMIFILCLACVLAMPLAQAQVEEKIDTREKRDIVLYRGDLVALKVYSLTRIAISTPGVVDIVNADVDEILLAGKALGQTQIFIWDEYGKRSVLARVMEQDLEMIKERIEQLLAAAEITGIKMEHSAYEGKLIAVGKVNKVQKEEFDKVIEGFGEFIINMVDEQGDLIQIDVQITELGTTLNKELGVAWNMPPIELTEDAVPDPSGHGLSDVFKIGDFARTDLITATIHALLSTSKARDIAKPSIVVSDGEEASIVVGGEVPITTSVTSDGSVTENVTYKSYGVQLSVTPEIMDDDKINITLNVSISNQDSSFGGDNAAFTTTTAQTKVLLDDGQTIIIAGLIQKGEEESESKVPFLHRIPILGSFLFTYKTYNKTPDKEIVISLTPHLRRQKNKLKTNKELQEEKELQEKASESEQDEVFSVELDEDGLLVKEQEMEDSLIIESLEKMPQDQEEENIDDILADIEEEVNIIENSDMTAGIFADITKYAASVQKKIAERISFPYQAKEEGWEGGVTLSLTILSDGTLNDVEIKESSGHNVFDNDAVNTAEIVAPFDPFPVEIEMDELTISVPVVYSQEAFLVND